MRYFHISNGLRGCYMPDSSFIVQVETRKELKGYVEDHVQFVLADGDKGGSKKAIAATVAAVWRDTKAYLPYCIPIKNHGASDYHYGVFVGNASRSEYLDQKED